MIIHKSLTIAQEVRKRFVWTEYIRMHQQQLLAYALKYQGNYFKIKQALLKQESYQSISTKLNYVTILDGSYPTSLKQLAQPPWVIFYRGNLALLSKPACSVIGSRQPHPYGVKMTSLITNELLINYVIVSGMAKGIDQVAHQTALKNGQTIAVLGSGIDYVYPASNQSLYEKLCQTQLVLSEYPGSTIPKRYYFLARNRLIAALGEFLVVTQATLKSGTFKTVEYALELGKEIYTIPYNLDIPAGAGCNELLNNGATCWVMKDEYI